LNDTHEELLDVVDSNDRVLGVAARARIHAAHLRHRSVHVLVVNANGDIYIQRRALNKDCSPGLWDTSAAGHVIHRESYEAAAVREVNEELSLDNVVLEPLCRLPATNDTGFEFVRSYLCVTEREPVPDTNEILETAWHTADHLQSLITLKPEHFTVSFKLIFAEYIEKQGA